MDSEKDDIIYFLEIEDNAVYVRDDNFTNTHLNMESPAPIEKILDNVNNSVASVSATPVMQPLNSNELLIPGPGNNNNR